MRQVEVVRLRPGARDRLITTLFLAALFHGMIILGVSFSAPDGSGVRANTLEVTLVATPDDEAPDDPDYLAQANQKGAGNIEERVRPESARSTLDQHPNPGLNEGWAERTDVNSNDADPSPDTLRADNSQNAPDPLVTSEQSPDAAATSQSAPQSTRQPLQLARLLTDGAEQADPISDENRQPLAHSDNPRERFISVNTRESRFARYLEEWRQRVEEIGNRHYPEEARQGGLTGVLSLEVAVDAEGNLREIRPRDSSGHPSLDRAAARIVRMAAPFPPFPAEVREDTDVLRFVYRWEFGTDRTLRTGVSLPANSN